MALPLAFGMPGIEEWLVIAFIGLLLFGKRLPEVGRRPARALFSHTKTTITAAAGARRAPDCTVAVSATN